MSERVERALMADALTWSTALPWMEGWWWVRDAFRNRPPEVVYVDEGPDGDFWTDDGCVAVDEMATGTEWAGPIPQPTGAVVGAIKIGLDTREAFDAEALTVFADNAEEADLLMRRLNEWADAGPLYVSRAALPAEPNPSEER